MTAPALQILMPMGGLGQRFRDAGIDTPKPLIPVFGVPMFKRALASFDPYEGERRVVVVIREDNDEEYDLGNLVRQAEPAATVVLLESDTRGAVETCLAAAAELDPELPLVIMDCDIAFRSAEYLEAIRTSVREKNVAGLLLSFHSDDPRYSFAELDSSGLVIRTAEKDAISSDALMGAYFFTEAGAFLDAARALMSRQISADMPEYYVSLVFNELIAAGRPIGHARGEFFCFGTPEELARFEASGQPGG